MDLVRNLNFLVLALVLVACQKEDGAQSKCGKTALVSSNIIIGSNDWVQFSQSGDQTQDTNERTVAQLKIPSLSAVCTGFLINEDTIMTNNHCISSAARAVNVTAKFRDVDGTKTTYNCSQFVTTSLKYDFALVKCENSPGRKFGWVGLSKDIPAKSTPIYLVQENCDYVANPYCTTDKFVAFGEILDSYTRMIYHDADTLGGSSGSPIFSKESDQVIAIHNSGSPATGTTVARNGGVPIYQVRGVIESTTDTMIYEYGTAYHGVSVPDPIVVEEDPETTPPTEGEPTVASNGGGNDCSI